MQEWAVCEYEIFLSRSKNLTLIEANPKHMALKVHDSTQILKAKNRGTK